MQHILGELFFNKLLLPSYRTSMNSKLNVLYLSIRDHSHPNIQLNKKKVKERWNP